MELVNQSYLASAENGELFIALSVYILALQVYFPACRDVYAGDGMQEGGFTGAGGTDDCGEFPFFDSK